MKVLPPVTITPDLVVDSNIFDTAPTAYDAGTTYAADAYASVAGTLGAITIYKSLQAANTGHTPASSPTWWVEVSTTYEEFVRGSTPNELGYRVLDSATNTVYEAVTAYSSNQPLDPVANPVWLRVTSAVPVQPADWSVSTTYGLGAYVYYEELAVTVPPTIIDAGVYRSNTAGNLGNYPSGTSQWDLVLLYPSLHVTEVSVPVGKVVEDANGNYYEALLTPNANCPLDNRPLWVAVGPSNRTACFDSQSSTQTIANKELTFTFTPGIIEAVALVNCLGNLATITVRDGLAGPIVYENTSGIAGDIVSDWYQYFFSDPTIQRTQVLFTDIPPYNSSHVTVTITGGFTVAVGDVMAGRFSDVGLTEFGVQIGIDDFSVVETDEFGQTTFVKRGNKKYMDARQWIKKADFNRAFNLLRRLPAVPCLWVAGDVQQYSEALMLKAYYKNFAVDIDGPDEAYCSLKLIGLI